MRLSLCFLVSVVSGAALVLAQNQEEKPVQPLKPLTWTPENIKCRTSRSRGISPTGPAPELKLCCEGADYKNCIHYFATETICKIAANIACCGSVKGAKKQPAKAANEGAADGSETPPATTKPKVQGIECVTPSKIRKSKPQRPDEHPDKVRVPTTRNEIPEGGRQLEIPGLKVPDEWKSEKENKL